VLRAKEVPPPYVPKIAHEEDISNAARAAS
jgi:hypothetical protein